MPLKMLILHEFGTMRRILAGFAQTELSEMLVEASGISGEGVARLQKDRYDLVLCGMEMAGLNGLEVHRVMRTTKENAETPFIIITSTDTEEQKRRLTEAGIEHYLITPFSALEMRTKVNQALNVVNRRTAPRFSLPGVRATLDLAGDQIPATVLNFSLGGLLIDTEEVPASSDFFQPASLAIDFPQGLGLDQVKVDRAVLIRLQVMRWGERDLPQELRLAWRFVDISPEAVETIKTAMEKTEEDMNLAQRRSV